MKNFFTNLTNFFSDFSPSDWILFGTLLAIIWYSWETRQLRKWQKRSFQMAILSLATEIKIAGQESLRAGAAQTAYVTKNFGETIRKIYREGKLDLKELYLINEQESKFKKIFNWIINKINGRF